MIETWAAICRSVVAKSSDRCAYCRMHQSLQGATFHIEHIVPRSVGGLDDFANLCVACPSCNLHKSNSLRGTDPMTGDSTRLFHPREQRWIDHFEWRGTLICGITAIGRTTVESLKLNSERRRRVREAEAVFRLFPPDRLESPDPP